MMPRTKQGLSLFSDARSFRDWLGKLSGTSRSETVVDEEEENPWLHLQSRPQPGGYRDELGEALTPAAQGRNLTTAPRWLSDSSPYGFADDDGTMRQVEGTSWRRAFGVKSNRFVPRTNATHVATQASVGPRLSSTWTMQAIAALVLVASGWYGMHGQSLVAKDIHRVYQHVFVPDEATQAVPAVSAFLQRDFHVHLPVAWWPSSAIRLHTPLDGRIVQDYSTAHPSLTLLGATGASVYAAGSGTITQVQSLSGGTMVEIDHGALGNSLYYDLASVSVHEGEYVTAGEVLGHVSSSQGHSLLMFAMEKDGQKVDPHDYITFPSPAV